MGIIKTYDEFLNENTFVDIIKKDREDYAKKENFFSNIKELICEIRKRISETKGSVLDLRNLGEKICFLDDLTNLFNQDLHSWYIYKDEFCYLPDSIKTIDVTGWNTSKVNCMLSVFKNCKNLEKIIGLETWDVSNVKKMDNLFHLCHNLKELNISNWNVSEVTNMGFMFSDCKSIENLDIEKWNVSEVNDMMSMFSGCEKLKELNISNWNVSKVTNMGFMFKNCESLEKLDIDHWNINKSKGLEYLAYDMFSNCNSLKQLPSWYYKKKK